jgi:hypothetical protein
MLAWATLAFAVHVHFVPHSLIVEMPILPGRILDYASQRRVRQELDVPIRKGHV